MSTNLPAIALLVDGCNGQFVPQRFINNCDMSLWSGISLADVEILQNPEHAHYDWTWCDVLDNATFSQNGYTWRLHQDDDLWAICIELMTEEEKENFGFY